MLANRRAGLSLRQVGAVWGLTAERVRTILAHGDYVDRVEDLNEQASRMAFCVECRQQKRIVQAVPVSYVWFTDDTRALRVKLSCGHSTSVVVK